jgi:Na+/melibiose symporter-like transporter
MVLPLAVLIAYIIFCILVGLCGSQRRLGFTGTFLLSLVITPVLMLIIVLITGPSRRAEMAKRAELARHTEALRRAKVGQSIK